MFKVLYWLAFDVFFLYGLISWYDEMGNYIFLFIAAVAFFTWELVRAFKDWIGK